MRADDDYCSDNSQWRLICATRAKAKDEARAKVKEKVRVSRVMRDVATVADWSHTPVIRVRLPVPLPKVSDEF